MDSPFELIDELDEALAIADRSGRIVRANSSFRDRLGLPPVGPVDGLLPASLATLIARHAPRLEGFTATDVRKAGTTDAPRYLIEARGFPARAPARNLLLRIRDGEIERAPNGAGPWAREAIDRLPHKVWVVNLPGSILYENRAINAFFGGPLPRERAARDAAVIHPADVTRLDEARRNARDSSLSFAVDVRLRRFDGVWRWHRLAITVIGDGTAALWLVLATDVDELHATTDRLRVAEERLSLAQAMGRVGLWEWTIETNETAFNTVYYDVMGLKVGAPHGYEDFLAMVHVDDRDSVRAACEATIRDFVDYAIEYRVVRPDGTVRWIAARGGATGRRDGRAQRFLGVMTDITDARQAAADRESLLRQIADQLQELEALYNMAPIGLGMLDDQLRFERINPRLAEMNGFSVAQHLGRTVWDLVPDLKVTAEPFLLGVLGSGRPVRDVELSGETAAAPGRQRYWIEHFYPLPGAEGRTRGIGIICEEVTDRRLAERRLRESEERLRLATEAAGIGVFEWDLARGIAVAVNAHMRDILGADSMIDRATIETVLHPEDRERLRSAIEAARTAPENRITLSARVRRPGETDWRHIEIVGELKTAEPTDRNGEAARLPRELTRLLGVARDITALVVAEETQRLLIGELNHRVKNTLATVQAIASQTLRRSSSPQAFVEGLTGRLQALSKAHNLLTESTWSGADLARLVLDQLALTSAEPRITLAGPTVVLPPANALRLGLVIHELGTNARKYGSLGPAGGQVTIGWALESAGDKPFIVLDWIETGGPPVKRPGHQGFGQRLIEGSLSALGGEARLEFRPHGLACRLRLPLQS